MLNSFVFYLKGLALWLERNHHFGYDQVSIHRSIKTANYLNTKPLNIYFLPPYSQQLAFVDLAFNHIKAHIKIRNRRNIQKLNAAKALNYSLEIMKPIEAKSVKGYYSNFLERLKSFLPII